MIRSTVLTLTATLVLAACNTTTGTTEARVPTVVDPLIGKTLTAGDSTFIFNADGSVGGSLRGENPIAGTWSANASQVCSSYTAPENLVGLGDICSVPEYGDGTVVFNRTNGTSSPVYTIEG